jgi:uridine kinase
VIRDEVGGVAARARAAAPRCGRTRLIAVDGPGGAGKTTFAGELAAALGGPPVVHSDDFYLPMDGDPLRWWRPFAEQVLAPLRAGRPGRFRRYDWHTGRDAEDIVVPPAPVVLVEGVGSAWRPAVPHLSLAVWVDAPLDVRVARTARRDGPEAASLWTAWRASETEHFAHDATRSRADVIIDGTRHADA